MSQVPLLFAVTCTWRRVDDTDDQRALDAALSSVDGVALVPSSVAVAARCELLLTCTPAAADAVESAGVVSIVLNSVKYESATDDSVAVAAQLVVNGGQDVVAMGVTKQDNGSLLFNASYDVHPRMTSSLRIKFANLASPSITLSAMQARMVRSKRLDAPRPPLSQLMQMFVPPPSQQQPQQQQQQQQTMAATLQFQPTPAAPASPMITRADLDAMEQRLIRHIDQRFDSLIAILSTAAAQQTNR